MAELYQTRNEVHIMKKRIVIALGHRALGTTFPEQKKAVKNSAKVLADMIEEGCQLVIGQIGVIHVSSSFL